MQILVYFAAKLNFVSVLSLKIFTLFLLLVRLFLHLEWLTFNLFGNSIEYVLLPFPHISFIYLINMMTMLNCLLLLSISVLKYHRRVLLLHDCLESINIRLHYPIALDTASVYFARQSIVVNWEPPPDGSQNGIITGYKVRCRQKQRGERSASTVTTDGNLRIWELTGERAFNLFNGGNGSFTRLLN